MPHLSRIIYVSSAAEPVDQEKLEYVLQGARRWNSEHNITGMLLYKDDTFFQILEGPRSMLDKTLKERILPSKMHKEITVIVDEEPDHREFGEWTMGFAHIDGDADLDGYNDFMNVDEQDAMQLLDFITSPAMRQAALFRVTDHA